MSLLQKLTDLLNPGEKDSQAKPEIILWYKSLDPAYQSKYDALMNDAANAASEIDSIGSKEGYDKFTMSAEGERVGGKTYEDYGQLVNEVLTLNTVVRTMADPSNQTPDKFEQLERLQGRYLGNRESFGSASRKTGTFADQIKKYVTQNDIDKQDDDLRGRFTTALNNGQIHDVDGDGIADIVQAAAYDMSRGKGWKEKDGTFSRGSNTGGTDTYHRIQSGELSNILQSSDGNSLLTAGSASPEEQVLGSRPVEFISKGREKGPNSIRYSYDHNTQRFFPQEKDSALKTPEVLPTGGDLGGSPGASYNPQVHTYQYLSGNDAEVGFDDRALYQREMVTDELGKPVNLADGQTNPTEVGLGDALIESGIAVGSLLTGAALVQYKRVAKKMGRDPEKLWKDVLDADKSGELYKNSVENALKSGKNTDLGMSQPFDEAAKGAIEDVDLEEVVDGKPTAPSKPGKPRAPDLSLRDPGINPLFPSPGDVEDNLRRSQALNPLSDPSIRTPTSTPVPLKGGPVDLQRLIEQNNPPNPQTIDAQREINNRIRADQKMPLAQRVDMSSKGDFDLARERMAQEMTSVPLSSKPGTLPKQTLNFDQIEELMGSDPKITNEMTAQYLKDKGVKPQDIIAENAKNPGKFKRLLAALPFLAAIPEAAATVSNITASTPAPGDDPIFDALGSSKVRDFRQGTAKTLIDALSPDPTFGTIDEAVKEGVGLYDDLSTVDALRAAEELRPEVQRYMELNQANEALESLYGNEAGAQRNYDRMAELRKARVVDQFFGDTEEASKFVEIPVSALDSNLGNPYIDQMAHKLSPFGVKSLDFQGEARPGAQLSGAYNLILNREKEEDAALLAQPRIVDYLRKKKRESEAALAEGEMLQQMQQEQIQRQQMQKPDFSGKNNPFYWDSDTFSKPF